MFITTPLFFRLIPRRNPLLIKGAGGVFYYKHFIRTSNYLQYPRVGLKRNFNRKGGRYNEERPKEGMVKVALLYMVSCPERLPAGGVFTGSW